MSKVKSASADPDSEGLNLAEFSTLVSPEGRTQARPASCKTICSSAVQHVDGLTPARHAYLQMKNGVLVSQHLKGYHDAFRYP